jgi:hypothetical protein
MFYKLSWHFYNECCFMHYTMWADAKYYGKIWIFSTQQYVWMLAFEFSGGIKNLQLHRKLVAFKYVY